MKLHLPSGLILIADKAVEKYLSARRCMSIPNLHNLLIAESLQWGCLYEAEVLRDGELIGATYGHNIIPTEGRNHILDTELHATSRVTTWYIAPFEANYTPVAGDTAATFPASATESTAYAEATRVAFVEAAASSGSTSNTANKAEFSINATKTMYGAFMTSVSTKSATTGTLLSAALFAASRAVISGDLLRITSTISLTSS